MFLLLKKVDIGDIPKAKQMTLFESVELDFEKNLLYSITFGSSSVTITKIRIPVFNIGLNEKLDTVQAYPFLSCKGYYRYFIKSYSLRGTTDR